MYCNRCEEEAVENQALGKKFHYCRKCKAEVFSPLPAPRSKDLVVASELVHFYVDEHATIHCAFCCAKEGETHTIRCGRKSSALLIAEAALGHPVDMPLLYDAHARKQCPHAITFSSGDTSYCGMCGKDLS